MRSFNFFHLPGIFDLLITIGIVLFTVLFAALIYYYMKYRGDDEK